LERREDTQVQLCNLRQIKEELIYIVPDRAITDAFPSASPYEL